MASQSWRTSPSVWRAVRQLPIEAAMKRLMAAAMGAPLLAKAQKRVSSGRYAAAIQALEQLARRLKCEIASTGMPLRANIIALQSAYWTRNFPLAEKAATVVVVQSNIHVQNCRSDTSLYIAAYLYGMMEFLAGRFPEGDEHFLNLAESLQGANEYFSASNVPKNFFIEMPLGENMSVISNRADSTDAASKQE